MSEPAPMTTGLPEMAVLRAAVDVYLHEVYGDDVPPRPAELIPPPGVTTSQFLAGDGVERSPADAAVDSARSFALRLGNPQYPNMKLRISRPPTDPVYVFHVDCHDEVLHAPPDSPDHDALEELKRYNAALASRVHAAWQARGLPTQETYLRWKIRQARGGGKSPS